MRQESTLIPLEKIAPQVLRGIKRKRRELLGPTRVQSRLIEAAVSSADQENSQSILYHHSIFCQTYLQPRDPGNDVQTWERSNGDVRLRITAGIAMHPDTKQFVPVGLPFGPKARLVLMCLNQKAILMQSPVIEVENSLTSFVSKMLKLHSKGDNINSVKEQLARLSASTIHLGVVRDGHATTINSQIVTAFDIWFPKDDRQRVLWPSTIQLSHDYFQNLVNHAVPLDETHIAALSHSSLALDIYTWLAQRLHRIPANKPTLVTWASLHGQFGQGYSTEHIRKFRQVFRVALKQVLSIYKAARVLDETPKQARRYSIQGETFWREEPATGLTLYNSPPPVKKLLA